jgi:hypothetical protein
MWPNAFLVAVGLIGVFVSSAFDTGTLTLVFSILVLLKGFFSIGSPYPNWQSDYKRQLLMGKLAKRDNPST